jgi:hypothetical protein
MSTNQIVSKVWSFSAFAGVLHLQNIVGKEAVGEEHTTAAQRVKNVWMS